MTSELIRWVGTQLVAATAPAPETSATPVPRVIDPERVTPGVWGFLSFLALILACVGLYFSMRKQLKRVDFDESAAEAGARDVDVFPARTQGPSRRITTVKSKNGDKISVEHSPTPAAKTTSSDTE